MQLHFKVFIGQNSRDIYLLPKNLKKNIQSVRSKLWQMVNYKLIIGTDNERQLAHPTVIYVVVLMFIALISLLVYHLTVTPGKTDIPSEWIDRAYQNQSRESHELRHFDKNVSSSKPGHSFITPSNKETLVVCYYTAHPTDTQYDKLKLTQINGSLCTHINVGMAFINNSYIGISKELENILHYDMPILKVKFPHLKILLCIGGGGSSAGFSDMVKSHERRKIFIKSVKLILRRYNLDGCDLDWEFPSAYDRERMHFSQLLYEIRREYIREKRSYLLSVAVAAPEGIAFFAYDVAEINKYADYVNLMSYDYHFFTRATPFTGFNAPLYARSNEHGILGTLNINYSVNWWLRNGLDRKKLIVGLSTYGHSFTLVNPFNTGINAPAKGFGHSGIQSFVSSGEICWFYEHNILSSSKCDNDLCSCYISSSTEWIAFDNATSIDCKAKYIKQHRLGGAMIFSLNTDDFQGMCEKGKQFPLTEVVYKILKTD